MHLTSTAAGMLSAAITILLVGATTTARRVAEAQGLSKIVALGSLCFAIPLAVFGALHLFGPQFIEPLVPKYMPVRMFWVYGIGCALIAAALSMATGRAVKWSGLLFGIMMFLFVLMLYLPGALRHLENRMGFTIVVRETSFGAAAWILAATAVPGWGVAWRRVLLTAGRFLVLPALVVFGIEQILHPTLLPGVPLTKEMPAWVPAQTLIAYLTGAALLVVAASAVSKKHTRNVAGAVGGWLLLLVVVIYGPVMIAALLKPETATQVEGINYFADTLLFAAVILALAVAGQGRLDDRVVVAANHGDLAAELP